MVHRIIKKAIYKGNPCSLPVCLSVVYCYWISITTEFSGLSKSPHFTVEYWLRFMSSHLLDIHSVMK